MRFTIEAPSSLDQQARVTGWDAMERACRSIVF